MKGRDESVEAWIATETLLPPGRRPRRMQTPLVGRDAELGVLANAIDAAVKRQRSHLLLLIGEAGVGKSRLAEEAAAAARRHHDARVLEGRCVPYGEANVWWPIAEALRQACAIPPDSLLIDAEPRARAAVAAALVQAADTPRRACGWPTGCCSSWATRSRSARSIPSEPARRRRGRSWPSSRAPAQLARW